MSLFKKVLRLTTALLLSSPALFGESVDVPQTSTSQAPVILEEGALRVIILTPKVMGGYYRGTRFDRSGMIPFAQYGRHQYFTTWESTIAPELNCGAGPTEEFDLSGNRKKSPPGYVEAKVGDAFLKIGVGWLRKEAEEDYDSYKFYSVIDPGIWTTLRSATRATFTHESGVRNGYGYRYEKEISIEGRTGRMIIHHTLKNSGSKRLKTEQYCHNFILVDSTYVGPGYEYQLNLERASSHDLPSYLQKEGRTWRFVQNLNGAIGQSYTVNNTQRPTLDVSIVNRDTGGAIRFMTDAPLEKILLYAEKKVICPEPFIKIDLEPGKEFQWSWEYTFSDRS